jgi:hypothetical protein
MLVQLGYLPPTKFVAHLSKMTAKFESESLVEFLQRETISSPFGVNRHAG